MAACLGLNLAQKICKSLETKLNLVTFWSDSTNVLWWIRGKSRRYKPFVANRVGMIHSVTAPEQWFYVPTAENPADLSSRGLSITKLSESKLWWTGPKFLMLQKEHWPKKDFVQSDEANTELKRKSMSSDCEFYQFFTEDRANAVLEEDRLDPIRYSSWSRFVYVFTWVNRFIDNCQLTEQERRKSGLLVEEIKSSEMRIIKKAQMESFKEDYQSLIKGRELSTSSKILALNPKLDEEGVMRSDSRLKFHEYLPYDVRFPIFLPRQNWITKLIIRHFHEQNKHCGTNQTLSALSAKYWIISAREEIRKVENDCYECRRWKAKAARQIMGPLPEFRLGKSMQAFSETAVDFAGPFLTKQGRGKVRLKRYLCVFTCMACRAVHLEIAYNLDTDSFMNTFYRFISRRGLPKLVVSDNGSNFIGAARELRELYDQLDKNVISKREQDRAFNGVSIHLQHLISVVFMRRWSKARRRQYLKYWEMQTLTTKNF
ncbi:uncharacterized protein LOC128545940 [Mercenaria mercenaria]|uniref:uncharacterized protein LOC128545940 n=1 Tax=Mercenaria mercenaria TaxID=6596 RepID=UPI00234E74DC|nr:uncharacterized protein LOC128545940 [Mercenaria mercenaria]